MRNVNVATATTYWRVEVTSPPPDGRFYTGGDVDTEAEALDKARRIVELAEAARLVLPKEAHRPGGKVTVWKVSRSPHGGRLQMIMVPDERWLTDAKANVK
jgi:hypothetical protein